MSREKKIEELNQDLLRAYGINKLYSEDVAEYLYNAGYCKQSEGEWIERTKTTTNAKGMEARYTINFCSECGYEIGTIRYRHKFCPNCGAYMRKEDEGNDSRTD